MIGTPFQNGNPGRQKGAKNKLTTSVREKVLSVFNELQNDPKASLKAFAEKYPRDFYAIAAKLIPTEVSGSLVTAVVVNEILAKECSPIEDLKNGMDLMLPTNGNGH